MQLTGAATVAALALAACGRPAPVVEPAASPAAGFPESADPVLGADPATGALLASFVARGADSSWQLYFARSADSGRSWTTPVAVTTEAGEVKPHAEASARLVAAPGGKVALIWAQDYTVEGRKWPASRMRFSRSLDGGATWSAALTLNDDTTAADAPRGHTFHGATWTGDSGLVVAWLDERRGGSTTHDHAAMDHGTAEGDATIFAVRSPDFGTTWTTNQPLWGATCPCCRVTLARGPDGTARAAWRRHFPGDVRDVVTAALPDSLTGAEEPAKVQDDGWVYPGCPHTGPALAIGAGGVQHVAWFTGKPGKAGIFLARSSPGKLGMAVPLVTDSTLPASHAAVVALPDNASLAAWDIAPGGSRRVSVAVVPPAARSASPVAVPSSDGATHPQLIAVGGSEAFLAYTALEGTATRISTRRIRVPN